MCRVHAVHREGNGGRIVAMPVRRARTIIMLTRKNVESLITLPTPFVGSYRLTRESACRIVPEGRTETESQSARRRPVPALGLTADQCYACKSEGMYV